MDNGHVFLPYAKLLTAAQRLLGTASSVLEDHLEGLTDRGTIVREEIAGQDACYLARLHYCETYVANALLEMEGEPLCPQRTWTRSWTEFSGNRVSPTPPCRWRR